MQTEQELKATVRNKYAEIARQSKEQNAASCCGATGCSTEIYNIMTDDYAPLSGYIPDADLGLGCGLPTAFAHIKAGNTVIDLGSGAGNDCFVARNAAGPEGKVIGVDFTPEMIERARVNSEKLGYNNVEFRLGDIEELPVSDQVADVVVSNCVLNLVPNKRAVIGEIFRVLKPGGHFSISDVVLCGQLPEALKKDAEMYAGCVSGAIQQEDYLRMIYDQGFEAVTLQKSKPIFIPDDILQKYMDTEAIELFRQGSTGILSITVYAERPIPMKQGPKPKLDLSDLGKNECRPESGCC